MIRNWLLLTLLAAGLEVLLAQDGRRGYHYDKPERPFQILEEEGVSALEHEIEEEEKILEEKEHEIEEIVKEIEEEKRVFEGEEIRGKNEEEIEAEEEEGGLRGPNYLPPRPSHHYLPPHHHGHGHYFHGETNIFPDTLSQHVHTWTSKSHLEEGNSYLPSEVGVTSD